MCGKRGWIGLTILALYVVVHAADPVDLSAPFACANAGQANEGDSSARPIHRSDNDMLTAKDREIAALRCKVAELEQKLGLHHEGRSQPASLHPAAAAHDLSMWHHHIP